MVNIKVPPLFPVLVRRVKSLHTTSTFFCVHGDFVSPELVYDTLRPRNLFLDPPQSSPLAVPGKVAVGHDANGYKQVTLGDATVRTGNLYQDHTVGKNKRTVP